VDRKEKSLNQLHLGDRERNSKQLKLSVALPLANVAIKINSIEK
jgi:hypothetical protein